MPEKKRCNTIDEMTLYDSQEMNYGSEFRNKSSSLNQEEDEEGTDGPSVTHRGIQKMDLHNYVDKEITFVRSNDIMKYARGKHTQLSIDWKVYLKCGMGCTTNIRMSI